MTTPTTPSSTKAAKTKLQSAGLGKTPIKSRSKSPLAAAKREFRESVSFILNKNDANLSTWLNRVADGIKRTNPQTGEITYILKPDPARALEILLGMAEFAAPKLTRTEHTGANGAAIEHTHTLERPKLTREEWLIAHSIVEIGQKQPSDTTFSNLSPTFSNLSAPNSDPPPDISDLPHRLIGGVQSD